VLPLKNPVLPPLFVILALPAVVLAKNWVLPPLLFVKLALPPFTTIPATLKVRVVPLVKKA
jgi:hypothetical protein